MLTWTNVSHTHAIAFAVGKKALGAHALSVVGHPHSQYQRLSMDVDQQQC